jgi:nicotinamidase/pyrazinamidase
MSCHYKPYSDHKSIKVIKSNISTNMSTQPKPVNALIVVDMQNEFFPNGIFPAMRGDENLVKMMTNNVKKLLNTDKLFDVVVFTQDLHPHQHGGFASTHRQRPFETILLDDMAQILLPDHCLIGSESAELIPLVDEELVDIKEKNTRSIDVPVKYVVKKGIDGIDGYSAFKNSQKIDTGLHQFLIRKGVTDCYFCGLARDFGVWWSCLDSLQYINHATKKPFFNAYFILDATLPQPGSIDLPEYNPRDGDESLPCNKIIREIGKEIVYGDLFKNTVVGNKWVEAMLKPFGVKTVSTEEVEHLITNDQHLITHNQQLIRPNEQIGGGMESDGWSDDGLTPNMRADYMRTIFRA